MSLDRFWTEFKRITGVERKPLPTETLIPECILYETFIPALRYHLPRHSISALTFPAFVRKVWPLLSEKDRRVAIRDVREYVLELEDAGVGPFARDVAYWHELLKWMDERMEEQ